jgi:competence protein ComEC
MVLRLEDGQESVLLAGDIERSAEQSLLDDATQPVNFLKVPHHGSRTSSTEAFLKAFRPRYAAISVGNNNAFGHPNAGTVERITAEGAQLYRTDQDGAVTALTDGHTLDVSTFRPLGSRRAPPSVAQADTAP